MPQFPKIPGAEAARAANAGIDAVTKTSRTVADSDTARAVTNISRPTIHLPPGVANRIPSRTVTGIVPGRVRDIVRYGAMMARRASGGNLPERADKAVGKKPVTTTPDPRVTAVKKGPVTKTTPMPPQQESLLSKKPPAPPFASRDTTTLDADGRRGFLNGGGTHGSGADTLVFEYNPEEVNISQAAGWIISDQPGRSHPFVQFTGNGQRRFSFTLRLFYTHNAVGDVLDNVNWLQSFLYGNLPTNTDLSKNGYVSSPKVMQLSLGKLLTLAPVIMLSADASYSTLFRPDLTPLYAEVTLQFLEMYRPDVSARYATERYGRNKRGAR